MNKTMTKSIALFTLLFSIGEASAFSSPPQEGIYILDHSKTSINCNPSTTDQHKFILPFIPEKIAYSRGNAILPHVGYPMMKDLWISIENNYGSDNGNDPGDDYLLKMFQEVDYELHFGYNHNNLHYKVTVTDYPLDITYPSQTISKCQASAEYTLEQ